MSKASIFHNPTAGDGTFSSEEVTELLASQGYATSYHSTKEDDWAKFDESSDLLVLAGGDGTVRKVVKKLLERTLLQKKFLLTILPVGTANNIAQTLYEEDSARKILENLVEHKLKKMDVGLISGLKEEKFFIEGIGMGVFPTLMKEIKELKKEKDDFEVDKMKVALDFFYDFVQTYEPKHCELQIDGKDYSGRYILIEILNIRSIGPNLFLAPNADPTDGWLDVVLISENEQEKFSLYIQEKKAGREPDFNFNFLKAKQLTLCWQGKHIHVDDQLIKLEKNTELSIDLQPGVLDFL